MEYEQESILKEKTLMQRVASLPPDRKEDLIPQYIESFCKKFLNDKEFEGEREKVTEAIEKGNAYILLGDVKDMANSIKILYHNALGKNDNFPTLPYPLRVKNLWKFATHHTPDKYAYNINDGFFEGCRIEFKRTGNNRHVKIYFVLTTEKGVCSKCYAKGRCPHSTFCIIV